MKICIFWYLLFMPINSFCFCFKTMIKSMKNRLICWIRPSIIWYLLILSQPSLNISKRNSVLIYYFIYFCFIIFMKLHYFFLHFVLFFIKDDKIISNFFWRFFWFFNSKRCSWTWWFLRSSLIIFNDIILKSIVKRILCRKIMLCPYSLNLT